MPHRPERRPVYRPKTATGEGPTPAWRRLFDVILIEAVLQGAAQNGKALSYAETLHSLGYDFSRPKMRALCAALNEVDARARDRGQPPLAVLVVRASDGLPGAGWWIEKDRQYRGPREGDEAAAYIRRKQREVFKYWRKAVM